MKSRFLVFGLLTVSWVASAECDTTKTARDAIRAIALISDRSMITDLVGGAIDTGEQNNISYSIYANYRNHGYSDKYEVTIEFSSCRVMSLRLIAASLPVTDGD